MSGYARITRDQFYRAGGFTNSRLIRVMRSGNWQYFKAVN